MSYELIEVKGRWNKEYPDAEGVFTNTAAIGVHDGSFDDDHIFYWFDDKDKVIGNQGDFTIISFTTEDIVFTVKSSGLTQDYRPNVVVQRDGESIPLWYHTTFYKPGPALEYLATLYEDGISQSDIDNGLWLTLQELQQQQ